MGKISGVDTDMDGKGTADLMVVNSAIQRYHPRVPGGEFGRPVEWHRAPTTRLGCPDARLTDLSGDGITDLLVTGSQFFTLNFRKSGGDWAERPRTIPVEETRPILRYSRLMLATPRLCAPCAHGFQHGRGIHVY
jgi:hypothetical protein